MKPSAFRHKKRTHHHRKPSGGKTTLSHLRSRPRMATVLLRRPSQAAPTVQLTRDPKGRFKFIKLALGRTITRPETFSDFRKKIAANKIHDRKIVDKIHTPADEERCSHRKARRSNLFRIGIAGLNKRNSPGSGGTYHRTEDSKKGC